MLFVPCTPSLPPPCPCAFPPPPPHTLFRRRGGPCVDPDAAPGLRGAQSASDPPTIADSQCTVLLTDPDNHALLRIDTHVPGSGGVGASDLQFLCRQPLWRAFQGTLAQGSHLAVCP
jgi:hypothetical protein